MTIINKTSNNHCWRGCVEEGTLIHCWWECKLVWSPWKTVWRLLKKLRIGLPHDPAIPLLGISSKNLKTFLPKDICIPMLIVSLLMVANHKCPLIDVCIKKMWDVCVCIHTHTHDGISFSHREDEILPSVTTWIDLENRMLSKIS